MQQVKEAISIGLLNEGDKLPTLKEAVTMTAVNANTVLKAYRELEAQGIVEGRPGIGVFVLKQENQIAAHIQAELLDKLSLWIDEAHAAKLNLEAIESLIHMALRNQKGE